ncbi:hypothetical protein [Neobacillus kokaensis]|uniref:Uncharacterized protein n=1 Tax=Neobacillus kokaensis TaxID=2759023 RepID=A0ABQ3MXI7_9BACI|nr:hypothetical protein [Neobacillus kokaensis]GHH97394.1 hypothetical protein AM1BK_09370 [Neobacillus kokaensis]
MHFRHIIISGLAVCGALFLQDHAFAAKNEVNGTPHSSNEAVQASVKAELPVKAENAVTKEKVSAAASETTRNYADKQKPSQQAPSIKKASVPKQSAAKKVVAPLKQIPEQAKGRVQSAINKAEKTVKSSAAKKAAAVPNKSKPVKKQQQAVKKEAKSSVKPSIHKEDFISESKAQPIKVTVKPFKKKSPASPRLSKPLDQKRLPKGKYPDENGKIPDVNQMLNQTQRTNGSGGSPNDRVSNGLGTISIVDKWFDWNQHYEAQLVQPYLSRVALLTNQWVNAPPSPPPQIAPIFKSVSQS